jgi:hypothetical protein
MACASWLDLTRRNPGGDDVLIDQPAVPGRCTASLHFVSKPFVVIDGAGQEIERDLVGFPSRFCREPIQLFLKLRRNV